MMKFIRNDGVDQVFGTTTAKTQYKSMEYHRKPIIPDKTLWHGGVSRLEESEIFEQAEDNAWSDVRGDHWWASKNLSRELGSEGELCAYFPKRSNPTDPAHGYPVSGHRHAKRAVPKDVARKWEDAKQIREVDRIRLKGRKL